MDKNNIDPGLNRTGMKMSPADSEQLESGTSQMTNPPVGDASAIMANRIRFIQEADSIGSMPGSFDGVLSAIQERALGGSHSFLDKVGERLAFERIGARLYEALLSKYHASEEKSTLPELERLEQFYLEEIKHFHLLVETMNKLGADYTALTPSADLAGVTAAGLVQIISDPRTSFSQSLEALLQAELIDHASWELLIELAEKVGLTEVATHFQVALEEESLHLQLIKDWVKQFNLRGGVAQKRSDLQ
jgi:tRNA isopentenyl-2-thiomethyl-A-37 hydroxylase MiaE